MATTNLGKVSVTPKGEYDPLITYERLDIISHNGSSYIVKQALTGVTPINGEFYALIAEKGDGGSFVKKAYKTYAAMDADKANIPANSSVDVTNDLDESKNGAYIYDGVSFTRSQYDSKVVTDKIIADAASAVQDAINNTAVDGGVLADTFLTVTANGVGTVARNQRDKNQETMNVKDFGAKEDSTTDSSVFFQTYADWVQENSISTAFFPANISNYMIGAPIVFNEPQNIKGSTLPSNNRSSGQNGNIIIGGNTLTAFRLGNGNGEPVIKHAEQWSITNLSFLPHNYTESVYSRLKTQTAIEHYSDANLPERGFYMNEFNANGMKYALHIKDSGEWTQLANLNISNSCISNNVISVLAEGNVVGMRFVGNQAEQCDGNIIKGSFSGRVTIEDNMLEGSNNSIYLNQNANILGDSFKNPCRVSIKGNYFEACRGDYLINLNGIYKDVDIVGNAADYTTTALKDFIKLKGYAYGFNNADKFPVFFYDGTYDLSRDTSGLSKYKASQSMFDNARIFSSYTNTPKSKNDITTDFSVSTLNNMVNTDVGNKRYINKFAPLTATHAEHQIKLDTGALSVGDIVSVHIAYFAYADDEGGVDGSMAHIESRVFAYTDGGDLIQNLWLPTVLSRGRVKTLTIPYRITKPVSNYISVSLHSESTIYIMSMSHIKEAAETINHLDEPVAVFNHSKPDLKNYNDAVYLTINLYNNVDASATINVDVDANGVKLGDKINIVSVEFSTAIATVSIVQDDKVRITLTNNDASSVLVSGEIKMAITPL